MTCLLCALSVVHKDKLSELRKEALRREQRAKDLKERMEVHSYTLYVSSCTWSYVTMRVDDILLHGVMGTVTHISQ
jgi:hypothetical protein